jgi:hypothetical protein
LPWKRPHRGLRQEKIQAPMPSQTPEMPKMWTAACCRVETIALELPFVAILVGSHVTPMLPEAANSRRPRCSGGKSSSFCSEGIE